MSKLLFGIVKIEDRDDQNFYLEMSKLLSAVVKIDLSDCKIVVRDSQKYHIDFKIVVGDCQNRHWGL